MNSPMPWVKLYIDILDDTKILRLTEACRWRFVQLVLMAGECDAEGLLATTTGAMSLDDIARRLRVRPARMEEQMASLMNVGLIEYTGAGYKVVKFAERQGRKQSEKREQWRTAQAKARQAGANQGPKYVNFEPTGGQIDTKLTQSVPPPVKKKAKDTVNVAPVINDAPHRVEKSREEEEKKELMGADAPAPPKKPSKTKAIQAEYVRLLGYEPNDWAQGEAAAAKAIGEKYSPAQFAAAYNHYKAQDFWKDKRLTLRYLKGQIPEFQKSKNGGSAPKAASQYYRDANGAERKVLTDEEIKLKQTLYPNWKPEHANH